MQTVAEWMGDKEWAGELLDAMMVSEKKPATRDNLLEVARAFRDFAARLEAQAGVVQNGR
jgi:hypothetical protein